MTDRSKAQTYGRARTLLAVALAGAAAAALGCHTPHQCPILQGMAGGTIPSPLPRAGDSYTVVGKRDGIRFYIVRYTDSLYRGGDVLNQRGAEALKQLGIRTIISADPTDKQRAVAKENGFALVEVPFGLNDLEKAHLDRFLSAVDAGQGPFYVHDRFGPLKAGALLASWRMHRQNWSADEAIKEYYRLDANYWDSLHIVKVLKESAPAPASPAPAAAPAAAPAGAPAAGQE